MIAFSPGMPILIRHPDSVMTMLQTTHEPTCSIDAAGYLCRDGVRAGRAVADL
jgi:hypothetical protein